MNLKTLNYIHELLVKNVDAAKKDLEEASDNEFKFKINEDDFNYENEEYRKLRDIRFSKLGALNEAEEVLKVFEEKDW